MAELMRIVVGMKVRLRKPHPCGSETWTVTRTGADVGMECSGCSRRVMLEREEFERRVRQVLEMPAAPESAGISPSGAATQETK